MVVERSVDGVSETRGKYRVLLELGQGGTACALLSVAHGPSGFSKLVVLKTPKKAHALDPEFRRMFLNEARLSARLNHANIVQANEVVEEDGVPILVMEFLDGQPLSNVLAAGRGSLPLAMHLQIITHALCGLHHAHELEDFDGQKLNVVHRDMTPHNIFVTYDGHVKILDFGIAKLDRGSDYQTETGVIKGKIRYMAPEQMMGEKLDRRADLYAVGVMLWEAATGERMWKETPDPLLMNLVLNGEIATPRSVNPGVPLELERVIMKALAPERDGRYATAAQLAADLEAIIDDLGTRVTSREVGKFVSKLFEGERAALKRSVEAQLMKLAALSWDDADGADREARSETGIRAVRNSSSDVPASGRKRRAVIVGAVCVALAVPFVMWGLAPGSREGPASPAPAGARAEGEQAAAAPAPAPIPERPDRPATVSVRIAASPRDAALFLDGQPLATNPFRAQVEKSAAAREVRAEAPGYTSARVEIVLDKDVDVDLGLQQEKRDTLPRPGPAPARVVTRASTAASAATPAGDCDPPYFFNEHGIKKFKPACL
ncbi:serine/threonine protein kinase [Sorangium sp. So ce1389]|uniref:serine/threonine protein kinase n=1 Tax=Sorangium sp. So ce1389 TaxID=3133336 RepID=UPI003F643F7F